MTTKRSRTTDGLTSSPQLPEQCDIPWRTGLRLGSGVDALAGSSTATALKLFETVTESARTPVEVISVDLCRDVEAVLRTISAELPWLEPLSLEAWSRAKAIASRDPFKPGLAILVWWSRTETYVRFAPNTPPSLTDDAVRLNKTDPAHFRDTYGDYYVSSAQHGSQLAAIITVSYEPAASDALKGAIDNLLSSPQPLAGVEVKLNTLLASATVKDVSARVFARAGADEPELLETFSVSEARRSSSAFSACIERLRDMSTSSNRPIVARLTHYSTLLPSKGSDRAVPLNKSAYEELQQLCSVFNRSLVRAASLPDRLVKDNTIVELRDRVRYLASDCIASTGSLVSPLDTRQEWLSAFEDANKSFDEFYDVYNLWATYVATPYKKPSESLEGPWEYGVLNSERTPYLDVDEMSWEPPPSFGPRNVLQFFGVRHTEGTAPLGSHIVGWRVKVLVQGTVPWRPVQGARPFRPRVRFQLPARSRSTWKFTIYYAAHEYLDILARAYRDELVVRYEDAGNEPVPDTPRVATVYVSRREIES